MAHGTHPSYEGSEEYRPALPPPLTDTTQVLRYLLEELDKISAALSLRYRLPHWHKEPPKPRLGDMVYTEGHDWDPGSGEGVYCYTDDGWIKL